MVSKRFANAKTGPNEASRQNLSLAFLAPDIVKAAIEGRLPLGMGLTRLADLQADWEGQRAVLGLR